MINKILVLLILNLSFINLAKSEDIKDFQIESISVGDKLNTHISDKVLKNGRKYSFKSPEYVSYEFAKDDFESDFVKFYDNIMLAVNNRNIIESVGGLIFYPDNIAACREEQSKVKNEIEKLFPNYRFVPYEHNHRADKTGKSIVYGESINIDQHQITIQCFDWNNKKLGFTDNLRVSIRTDEYNLFLRDKAF